MRLAAWFVLAFVGTAAYGLGLNMVDVAVWPVVVMALIVGSLLIRIKPLEPFAVPGTLGYAATFGLSFLLSYRVEGSERLLLALFVAKILLGLVGIAFLIAGGRNIQGSDRRRLWPLALALFLGVLVGYFSGDAGSAVPMRGWLSDWFSPAIAEAIVWTVRKSVHVVFYGLMAFAFYRAAKGHPRAAVLAAVFALSHGVFDEARQSFATTRFGTPVDILFDAAGVLIALAWAKRRR